MSKLIVSEQEYDKLTKQLEFYDTMRNQLLSFSFTAVLTIMGAALAISAENINVWIYLTPYLLVIPFPARISYYRLASIHITSFLKKFAAERMLFEKGTEIVKEGQCKYYKSIAWLVNHEMVMLAATVSIIFYIEYFTFTSHTSQQTNHNYSCSNFLAVFIPLVLFLLVYLISNATYNNKILMDCFMKSWNNYIPPIYDQDFL